MSALFKSELLEELQAKVANDAYVLYEALATCLTETNVNQILPEAIEQVTDYVHSIGEYAGKAHLLGLQKICDLAQQQMLELETQDNVHREILCGAVERWPRLVSNYLYAPDDQYHCQQLISSLQHTDWQTPLSHEQAQELTTLLTQDVTAFESTALSSTMIEPLSSDTMPILFDNDADDTVGSAMFSSLSVENKSVNRFDELSAKTLSHSFTVREEVALDDDDLTESQLFDELELTEANADLLCDTAPFDVLAEDNQLPKIIDEEELSDFSDTEGDLLTDVDLEEELFAEPSLSEENLDEFDEIELLENITAFDALATHTLSTETPTALASNESPYLSEIVQEDQLLSEESTQETDSTEFARLSIFDHEIIDLAENDRLLDEAAFELADEESLPENVSVNSIRTYQAKILENDALIENKEEHSVTPPVQPFTDVSEQEFDKILDEVAFDTAHEELSHDEELPETEEIPAVAWDDESFDEENDELEEADRALGDLDDASLEDSVLALQTSVNSYPSEFINKFEENRVEASEKLENFYLEDLENLSNRIVELSDVLSVALNKFVTEENDTEPFLESIEEYTNAIQSLWEAAEKCGLTGLQDVCTFISDNIFELSGQSQSERFALHDLLAVCPQLILDYLHNPKIGSENLVLQMQNKQWNIPLTKIKANHLVATLHQEAEMALQGENQVNLLAKQQNFTVPYTHYFELPPAVAEVSFTEESEVIESQEEEVTEDAFVSEPTIVISEGYDDATEMMAAFDAAFGYQETEKIVDKTEELLPETPIVQAAQTSVVDEVESEENLLINSDVDALSEEMEKVAEKPLPEMVAAFDQVDDDSLPEMAVISEEEDNLENNLFAESEIIMDSDAEIAMAPVVNGEVASTDIQLAELDVLDLLDAEISDAINDLSKALSKFTTAADNSPELLEAVEQYTDNVRSIAGEAEVTGLIGLKEICEFVEENVFELSTHAHAIRRNAHAHIEKWPHLVLYYLHDPLNGAKELVNHLSAPAWFLPLSQEHAGVLLHRLTQGVLGNAQTNESIREDLLNKALLAQNHANIFSEVKGSEVEEITPSSLIEKDISDEEEVISDEISIVEIADEVIEEKAKVPEIALATPETLELLISQITETNEELSRIFNELTNANEDNQTVLVAIENYTENVQTIWDTAEMAGLIGLQEVCTFVNDNTMALGGENQQVRNASRDVFETWVPFVLEYLRSPHPGADELVTHLQAVHWPRPLSSEQAEVLKSQLLEKEVAVTVTTLPVVPVMPIGEQEIALATPEALDLLIGQITDVGEELATTLQTLVEAEEGSEELLTIVETYTDNVQAIWDAADMIGLVGVQDVCTFVNDNITMLSASDKATRTAAYQVFSVWHLSVLTYLQTPRLGALELINQLQDARWVAPLDVEQAEILKQRLLTPVVNVKKEERISSDVTSVQVSSSAVQEDKSSSIPVIVLADPDVLALIIGQITDISSELSATLTQLIQAEDGSETLLTAVETYTENVQAIWDAADMAGLVGLQDVCTFINDNVMLLSAGDQPTRQAAHEVFDGWAQFVLAYLNNPATGAVELVKFMQRMQWFAPLDSVLATTLQQRLIKNSASAKPVEQKQVYLADPDVLAVVCSQITDVMDGLSEALKVCVSMENDNPALLEAIENYTNSVQAIWDTAEMAGLNGLQEVCTFVNDNLMVLSTQEHEAKVAAQACFIQWPTVVLAYLQAPLDGVEDLVNLLQNPNWPTPLASEQADTLLPLLIRGSSSPVQVAAYKAQLAEELADAVEEDESSEPMAELEMGEGERQEISLGSAEVLEILTSELESSKEDLIAELEKFTTLANQDPSFAEAAENYGDIVMRLHAAAEMLGLEGLQAITTLIVDNVKALATKDLATRGKAKKVLEAWPDLVSSYLNAPMAGVISMLNHFRETGWAIPLPDEKAHELLSLLTQSGAVEDVEESSAYARQVTASPEDVVLTLPGDINPDLFEAYLQETPQHASDFSQLIQSIIADPQIQDIERAQRIAHTLKGSSNIIGIKGIASMGHHLEDILEYLAKNRVKPPKELTDVMVEAADCIEAMVDSLTGQDPPDNAQQVLQSVLDWANRIDKGNLDAPPSAPRSAPSAKAASSAVADDDAKAEAKPKKEGGAAVAGTPEQVLRVPTKTVDDLMRLVGELSISLGQIQERLKHVIANTRTLTEQNLVLQKKTFELENLVDVRGITGVERRDSRQSAIEGEVIEFDALEFEEYNELHSVAHSFIESIADNRELGMTIRTDLLELEGMIIQQGRLSKDFQSTIMTTRMVPVSTMVSKLQRNVRQTCRATGKQAELVVEGIDILMDSDVLNNLGDPLQHILRNSIDHGLEMPDERVLLGKSESGTVTLRFYREGNNIVVSCKDDGQGLNFTNIRYTAIQRGLLTEGQEVTEAELSRLILMSGFSTKSGVTQMSGRGVGMDVVHTNIRQMKGTLDILSETGKGTTMLIKLPMTLVTVHVLIVRIGQFRYGIPTNTLEQALAHGIGELQRVGNEISFKMGKHIYPLKILASLLNVTGDSNEISTEDQRPLILVREETGIVAVIVDELLDTHDLVMKSMGQYVKKVRGVSGAAILGDGTLVPLLDVPELLRSPMQAAFSSSFAGEQGEVTAAAGSAPHILIIDDSLSVRKSLSLLVEDAGFEVLLAKDGLEGIEVMNQKRPNVILVDMEMPRMNGLEFTTHVRANKATEKLPIFMITSRTTEKHREQAKAAGVSAYVTKPYQDTELLDLIDKGLAGKI